MTHQRWIIAGVGAVVLLGGFLWIAGVKQRAGLAEKVIDQSLDKAAHQRLIEEGLAGSDFREA